MTVTTFLAAALVQALALSFVMMLAWQVQQRTGNNGWIDAVWTFGLGIIGVVSALVPLSDNPSLTGRQLLVAALVAIWAARLGIHIVQRSSSKSDDPRYAQLVDEWGSSARREMFALLQKQALVSIPLAIAILLAAHNTAPLFRFLDGVAVIVFLAGLTGGAIADRQLAAFASEPENSGRVCDVGLWRYSRHPNYFFEWMLWLSYPLLAIDLAGGNPLGWLAFAAPIAVYWLLNHVTGIPPLEEHMVRRYGSAYVSYQAQTNAFFPGPPTALSTDNQS